MAQVRGGSNTLRGGKNTYNAHTLNDNWVEDRYDPVFDGVRPNQATTAHRQDLEATKTTTLRYGGSLQHPAKFDDTIDYSNTIGYDTTAYPEKWESVTHSVHAPPAVAKPTEFSTSFHLGETEFTNPSKAEEYRQKWTRTAGDQTAAYTSEANRVAAGTVKSSFNVSVMRKYPGVPKSVEEFKEKIVERSGVTGIRRLSKLLTIMDTSGEGLLSRKEFKFGLQDYGLDFTEGEFFSLWNYFDKDHSGFIDFGEFLRGVRGPMSARRTAVVSQAFEKLDRTGNGSVSLHDLRGVYDASCHPDVASGRKTQDEVFTEFVAQWEGSSADGTVTFEEFASYYDDISAAVGTDDEFEAIIRSAWRLGDEKK